MPYFLGNIFVDLYYVILAPILFSGAYWNLTLPQTSVSSYCGVAMATVWWSSGAAYAISAVLPTGSTLVATVFLCLVTGAFVSGLEPTVAEARGSPTEWLLGFSFSRCDPRLTGQARWTASHSPPIALTMLFPVTQPCL